MLAAPNIRKPSRLPTVLMALAVGSAVSYFAFFRHKAEAPAAHPPVAPAPAAAALPTAEPPVAAVPEAPKSEPVPEPKRDVKKPVVPPPVAVVFTPPPRSVKTEIDELIAD